MIFVARTQINSGLAQQIISRAVIFSRNLPDIHARTMKRSREETEGRDGKRQELSTAVYKAPEHSTTISVKTGMDKGNWTLDVQSAFPLEVDGNKV
jgi:hypothetical protein